MIAALALWFATAAVGPDLVKEADGVVFCRQRAFRIPLDLSDAERKRISAVRLFVSQDQGKTWVRHSDGPADLKVATFRASNDGPYWFIIALIDPAGQQTPADVRGAEPGLKVMIDSKEPTLVLKPVKSSSGRRGVRWEVADENLDPASVRMAVSTDAANWQPYAVRHPEKSLVWFEDKEEIRGIQVMVKDRAGNSAVAQVDVRGDKFSKLTPKAFALVDSPDWAARIPDSAAPPEASKPATRPVSHSEEVRHTAASPTKPATSSTIYSNSKRVSIQYEIDPSDRANLERMEIWGTRDNGANWVLLSVDEKRRSPLEVEFEREGIWGLAILAAAGQSTTPKAGTEPDVIVEIDMQAPQVQLSSPELAGGRLLARWTCTDKNLAARPVALHYATDSNGPWRLLTDSLAASGEHLWDVSKTGINGPVLLKVSCRDQAGNVGSAMSAPVQVGNRSARVRVLDVRPN